MDDEPEAIDGGHLRRRRIPSPQYGDPEHRSPFNRLFQTMHVLRPASNEWQHSALSMGGTLRDQREGIGRRERGTSSFRRQLVGRL